MSTPRQFFESFLQAMADVSVEHNARLAKVHAGFFGEPLLNHAQDFLIRDKSKSIENVQEIDGSAFVITHEPLGSDSVYRNRYHLSAVRGGWKITRIDRECIHCSGTGRAGRVACSQCGGDGWYDPRKAA